ncbi:hypothetical protein VNI00_018839 [Paramarasmius palmivorus]|uniref:Transmembrane protein n=1 Tax=Paramarasmius palmivorus TaxID=297713 RepID=A0AAW0ATQ2_9AGAR
MPIPATSPALAAMVSMDMARNSREETQPLMHDDGKDDELEMSERATVKDDGDGDESDTATLTPGDYQAPVHDVEQHCNNGASSASDASNINMPQASPVAAQNADETLRARQKETCDLVTKWIRWFSLTALFLVVDLTLWIFTPSSVTEIVPLGTILIVEFLIGLAGVITVACLMPPESKEYPVVDPKAFSSKIPLLCVLYCWMLHVISVVTVINALMDVWPQVLVWVLVVGLVGLTGLAWWYSWGGVKQEDVERGIS